MVASKKEENEPEWNQHGSVLEGLARDLHVSVDDIRHPYEIALKELNENSRVKVFLHLLVGRKVREMIKEKPDLSK
ncbi:MAG: hypothetical protein ACHQYP_02540 [Nitrospiria bacterium]